MLTAEQAHDLRSLPYAYKGILAFALKHWNSVHLPIYEVTEEQVEELESLGYGVFILDDTVLVRWPC